MRPPDLEVGYAVDYSRATQVRPSCKPRPTRPRRRALQGFAGLSRRGLDDSDGPIAVGVTDAQNIFNANRANLTGYTLNSVTPTVAKTGSTVTSTVSFTATINTMFLNLIGKSALTMNGTSTSTANMPLYVDF